MSDTQNAVKLQLEIKFGEWESEDARIRGYLSHVVVELPSGVRYPVFFYDPVRLAQDLESDAKGGRPFIADPGMIVVPEVTVEYMQIAAQRAAEEGFFEYLQELRTEETGASSNRYQWPP